MSFMRPWELGPEGVNSLKKEQGHLRQREQQVQRRDVRRRQVRGTRKTAVPCDSLNKCFLSSYSKPWGLLALNSPEFQPTYWLGRAWERQLEQRLGLGRPEGGCRGVPQAVLLPEMVSGTQQIRQGEHKRNCLIKDAFSIGFCFRANSISRYVESKRTQLPRFNNKADSTAPIPGEPCFTFCGFSNQWILSPKPACNLTSLFA